MKLYLFSKVGYPRVCCRVSGRVLPKANNSCSGRVGFHPKLIILVLVRSGRVMRVSGRVFGCSGTRSSSTWYAGIFFVQSPKVLKSLATLTSSRVCCYLLYSWCRTVFCNATFVIGCDFAECIISLSIFLLRLLS